MLKEDRDLLVARFEERRLAWEKIRRRGKAIFVLIETLKFGGLIVLSSLGLDYLVNRDRLHRHLDHYSIGGYVIILFVVALMEMWEWHRNEKRYRKK